MSDITTIYGKPGCRACLTTKRTLAKNGIEHKYVDFTQDEDAYALLKDNGVLSAPYVVSPVGAWSGLDEGKLAELIEYSK